LYAARDRYHCHGFRQRRLEPHLSRARNQARRSQHIGRRMTATNNIQTFSIAEPGYSDAIEFTDGKLIFGKQQSVSEISWQSVLQQLSIDQFNQLIRHAGLIAFVNWGIVFSM